MRHLLRKEFGKPIYFVTAFPPGQSLYLLSEEEQGSVERQLCCHTDRLRDSRCRKVGAKRICHRLQIQ